MSSIRSVRNARIASCWASSCVSSLPCSVMSSRRTCSSSASWRDISLSRRVRGILRGDRLQGRLAMLLRVRLFRFDLPDDAADELLARAAGHVVGQVLVVKGAKRLAAASAVEQLAAEGAFARLLEQRAEEGLRDPDLGLLNEAV